MTVMSKKGRQVLRRREKGTPKNWRLKKGRQVFQENRGVTPSVAAPGVTHPSDATEYDDDDDHDDSVITIVMMTV